MSLDRAGVVDAALAILDSYGLADLSMRRLADSLGVKAGALYWHVANKQSLLALVADRLLVQATDVAPGVPVTEALTGWATSLRTVLLAHRDGAELVASALASGLCAVDPLEQVCQQLRGVGLQPAEAAWGARALLHLVLGHVVEEQNVSTLRELGVRPDGPVADEQGFSFAVCALVAGLLANAGGQ